MAKRQLRSEAEIEALLVGYEASGQTLRDYCQGVGLAVTTLDYYRARQFRRERRGGQRSGEFGAGESSAGGFGVSDDVGSGRAATAVDVEWRGEELRDCLSRARGEIARMSLELELLHERIRLILLAKYGPRSEKLSHLQLSLLEEEPGATLDEVAAEAARPALAEEAQPDKTEEKEAKPPRQRENNPGRRSFPEHLARVEEIVACAPEACRCGACGEETAVLGYEESERLDCEAPRLFVRVIRREKRVCRRCAEAKPVTDAGPPSIVEKGLAGDALVVETIVAKYSHHVPLYRQSEIWRREARVDLSRATLDAWVMWVSELLVPLTRAMRRQLLASEYLQADKTTVPAHIWDNTGVQISWKPLGVELKAKDLRC